MNEKPSSFSVGASDPTIGQRLSDWTSQKRESIAAGMMKRTLKRRENASLVGGEEEAAALVTLYEQYKRPIHTYIYRLLANREDADDLTQEVFMRAFLAWGELSDRDNLSPWLYRIATNLCVDMLRRRKRIAWWPLMRRGLQGNPQMDQAHEEEAPYLPSNQGGIPEVGEREQIRLILDKMPEEYAIILVLHAAQGVHYQDIATIMDISPGAAATRISRAKRMFAEHYRSMNEEHTRNQEQTR